MIYSEAADVLQSLLLRMAEREVDVTWTTWPEDDGGAGTQVVAWFEHDRQAWMSFVCEPPRAAMAHYIAAMGPQLGEALHHALMTGDLDRVAGALLSDQKKA